MQEYLDSFLELLNQPDSTIGKVIGGIIVLVVGWWVVGMITRVAGNVLNRSKVDASLKSFMMSLVSVSLKVLVIISAVTTAGVETTSFVAILGAASFAIGLAL